MLLYTSGIILCVCVCSMDIVDTVGMAGGCGGTGALLPPEFLPRNCPARHILSRVRSM